jgi:putative addiction module CopG family antidote
VRTTQQLSITLPNAMADLVRSKVSTGEYASESEVIREGIRSLMARDKAIESWLSQSIGPRFDKAVREPDALLSITEARSVLKAKSGAKG